MRSFFALLAIALCVAYVYADCDEAAKNPEDGDVKTWFKNAGCEIKEKSGDLAEKIGKTAKDIGSTVAEKYDQLKHKLTDDNSKPQNDAAYVVENAPTEKIPLAPLMGEARAATA